MSNELVSIIIPCFNAARWLKEAVDSCLNQTYSAIEIIVIDDGSTDESLDIIKSYDDKIIWETGENRGGNHARNSGFALSKGKYIQFLDADDYILPEKIARQVSFLEQTGVDIVYGDWRHRQHLPSGKTFLEDIKLSGEQEDILESLLADWWVSPACILFTREIVEKSEGWDEDLKVGQDRDFFLSLVMDGAEVSYQPGCYSVYRRYGKVTVSGSSPLKYLESHYQIVQKAERKLLQQGRFTSKYRFALAQSYFTMARTYLTIKPDKYYQFKNKALLLNPEFKPNSEHRTIAYSLVQNLIGFNNLEKIVSSIKLLKAKIETSLIKPNFKFHHKTKY
ncbi:MAG: glycosyltransferase [Cyanobacteria bacterium J06648_1]